MNKSIIATILLCGWMNAAQSDWLCYEADKQDISARTPWSHTYFFINPITPAVKGPDGRKFMPFNGYGYNDAPTPNGGTDTVPFSGSAVEDVDGTWIVSINGTLSQQSTLNMLDHNGTPTYWQISQNWILQPGGKEGIGIFGNENRHFNPKFSVKRDDRIEVYIWRIDCKAFTQ